MFIVILHFIIVHWAVTPAGALAWHVRMAAFATTKPGAAFVDCFTAQVFVYFVEVAVEMPHHHITTAKTQAT
ncbi:MAG: hypothetical protein P4L10_11080 [Acidobacteriaceae bacterium]|nr:hypothetical protein [Acidobacteriaceae bacterium]